MSIIFLLIMVSICLAVCFLIAFLWAVRNGQYEDDYSPSVRILFDDQPSAGDPVTTGATSESIPHQNPRI